MCDFGDVCLFNISIQTTRQNNKQEGGNGSCGSPFPLGETTFDTASKYSCYSVYYSKVRCVCVLWKEIKREGGAVANNLMIFPIYTS